MVHWQKKRCIYLLPTYLFLLTSTSRAELLTFELTALGNTPVDDGILFNPYTIPGGTARFFFDDNANNVYDSAIDTNPRFERAGTTANEANAGFRSTLSSASSDTARDEPGLAAQLGNWFLRKQGDIDTPTPVPFIFMVDYDTTVPIVELSGEIWDIDAFVPASGPTVTEQWRVDVLSSTNEILASQLSPLGIDQTDPASLDGKPWQFTFTNLPSGVDKIRMTFVGSKVDGVGIAFNNFSPTVAIPEPSLALLTLGMPGALLRRRYPQK